MKNQYFGDINDYRKYGILRCLSHAGLRVGVHWMLTPDDLGTDGRKLGYLDAGGTWRDHDPGLFDFLRAAVGSGQRVVGAIENSDLLDRTRFFSEAVPDRGAGRTSHFTRAFAALADSDLVFFDPDNGIEVPSTPLSSPGSCKYVYWSEIEDAWGRGHSLLIYQHYPRVARQVFEARIGEECRRRLGTESAHLRTGNVLFVLVPRPEHAETAGHALRFIESRWRHEVLADPIT